jgi:hypothetical protein
MWIECERSNPYWGRVHLDEFSFVTVNSNPSVAAVAVHLFATGSEVRVPLNEWEHWLSGAWANDPDLHPINRKALAEAIPALRSSFPRRKSVIEAVDWREKQTVAEHERQALRRREEIRLAEIAEANAATRKLELKRKHKGIGCPRCGLTSRDHRFLDGGTERQSYFVCASCGRSFADAT